MNATYLTRYRNGSLHRYPLPELVSRVIVTATRPSIPGKLPARADFLGFIIGRDRQTVYW